LSIGFLIFVLTFLQVTVIIDLHHRKGVKKLTINERIKRVRKEKGMNQKHFAALLGVTQSGVSYMEQSGSNVSDSSIKSICTMCNLNEDWLRNGTEPMYIQEPTFSLDDFVRQHGGTELELDIMKAYFELEPDIRAMLVQHFKERLTASHEESAELTMTVEEAEEEYKKSISNFAKSTISTASSTTINIKKENDNDNKAANQ